MTSGAQPLTEKARKRAIGLLWIFSRYSSETTRATAAPSVICEELPAVTGPFDLEGRPDFGKRLDGGAGADAVVDGHQFLGADRSCR